MILDGKSVANNLLTTIRDEIALIPAHEPKPTLSIVLVGENPASLAYIRMKQKRCEEVGINFLLKTFDKTISESELERAITHLANDVNIHGIIVQAPLPKHIDAFRITELIPEKKDVDGFSRAQIGNMFLGHEGLWSCTPKGIMTLIQSYNIPVEGKKVVVVGRSNIVGKPMALMFINQGATVVSCNSKTQNIANHTKNADIIVVAVGKPKWLTRDMVSPESTIIDVGSNLLENGKFCGDVDFENLKEYVRAISPSPGGVGPMTIAILLDNTYRAFLTQK